MLLQRTGGRGDTEVWRAEVLYRVRHLTQLSSASSAGQDLSSAPLVCHWSRPPPCPTTTIVCLGSPVDGCVFVCVSAFNSEDAPQGLTVGILDALSPIHFCWAPDVC